MKFLSLFSGIGGFDLGFERAGMKCVGQCEIDKHATKILQERFGVKIYDDVRKIDRSNCGTVDLICGGFPCQDLSIAGKRKGLDGKRSGLWFEFARIIDELNPKWVVIENVPGLLSSHRGEDFKIILEHLAKSGYGVVWRVLDAQYFGVAQRRRRVFIVASFGNGASAEILFERDGMRWDTPPRRSKGETVAGTITSRVGKGGFTDPVNDNIFAVDVRNLEVKNDVYQTLQAKPNGGQSLNYSGAVLTNALTTNPYCDRAGEESKLVWSDQGGAIMNFEKEDISPTLRAQDHGHPPLYGVRRLTPLECERLQGFPDGWTSGQSDTQRYKQLGNAVAVPVAEWIGKRIMEVENG